MLVFFFSSTRGGAPREVALRIECTPASGSALTPPPDAGDEDSEDATLTFLGIEEPPDSCLYTITVGSQLVCRHPGLARSRSIAMQAERVELPCYAMGSSREAQAALSR